MRIIFYTLLAVVFNLPAFAATWYVEKDGSGDFTVIQDAVDAAADGDVIEIGAGRFDDYSTIGNWDDYVFIADKSPTLRGSGPSETIIGPTDPEANSNYAVGIASIDHPEFLKIENLSIENINRVAVEASSSVFEMENCIVVECRKILQAYDCGGFVRNCSFSSNPSGLYLFSLAGEFFIEDCIFDDVSDGIHVNGGSSPFRIQNCELITEESFWPSQVGIQISGGASGEIANCWIEGYFSAGVAVLNHSQVSVHDCTIIQHGGTGLWLGNNSGVQFHDNILVSGSACIRIAGRSLDGSTSTALHNNHILREGDGLFVKNWTGPWGPPPEYFNMTHNFWGTQDPEEISAYIEDGYSIPELDYYINFIPIADGPVPTEMIRLGEIKALYR